VVITGRNKALVEIIPVTSNHVIGLYTFSLG